MDEFGTTQTNLMESSERILGTIADYLPSILGALILLLGGILVAAFVRGLVERLIKWTHISTLFDALGIRAALKRVGIQTNPIDVIGEFFYWTVYLIFIIAAFEALGMTVVVDTLNQFVAYLPQILIASITALLTLVIARWVKKGIQASTQNLAVNTDIVSSVAEIAVYVFGSVIVLSQLGLDMTIITANITVIVASMAVALAFLFAFGGRILAANMLGGMFVRDYVTEGQKVIIMGKSGTVSAVKRTGVILSTLDGEEFIPHALIQQHGSLLQK